MTDCYPDFPFALMGSGEVVFRPKGEYTLQERERLDALSAAMILLREAEHGGVPFPSEHLHHHAVETWDGAIANLMAICNDLWEKAGRR